MNKKLEHIIFDFDGVIADTADINWALSQEHDKGATYEDFLAHHDGNVFEEPRIKFEPEKRHLFHSEYRNRLTPSHLKNAILPLKHLGALYKLHIVSSTSEESINIALEQSGLLELFSRVMGQETHFSKVEKFKMLMQGEGVTPENSIFITDTLGDIKEAHKVGIRTIGETFGFHNRERLEVGEPYAIVDSWEEIERIIESA
jgi:phosphoglycolate phosphatase